MAVLTVATFKKFFDEERIRQLTTETSPSSGRARYNQAIVEDTIAQADGTVKNMLRNQYTVAQIEADKGVERIIVDLAIYYLYQRRPGDINSDIVNAFNRATTLLDDLQSGKSKLAAVDQLLPSGTTSYDDFYDDTDFFDSYTR